MVELFSVHILQTKETQFKEKVKIFNLLEIVMGELKSHGELVYQLVYNVKELQEDGQEARVLGRVVEVASQVEPVPERHPLLLD